MLDITKKYWIDYGPIAVRCSIDSANVCFNLSGKAFGKGGGFPHVGPQLEDLNISDEAKAFYIRQRENGLYNPTAFPDDQKSIEYLKELEALKYIVFYDVDEPIGHNLCDDELINDGIVDPSVFDIKPSFSLEEIRVIRWNDIANSCVRAGCSRPEMPEYPKKEYGMDWFEFEEEEIEAE